MANIKCVVGRGLSDRKNAQLVAQRLARVARAHVDSQLMNYGLPLASREGDFWRNPK